ncbi:MAG TPA: fumarylacetoacetate hydrolase family protein [Thermomicrobiales bacterium]|jgi:2-keto-4-pentenoate hydratase/2-oxohepta-3-ene-1,7-dioic acid hydratase in catechol pathway|nr:fumarylacetoacetate hydrolase family protein [Thermomicrobiales bacterium]
MKLLTMREGNDLKLGIKTDAGVIDVAAAEAALGSGAGGAAPTTMDALLADAAAGQTALADLVRRAERKSGPWLRDEASVAIGPAVPHPGKIVCVGLNYRQHAIESGAAIPQTPVLFSKFGNAIAAPDEDVPLSKAGTEYDYEVELGFVLGREARDVPEADALSHVFGYFTANDLSCRDLQMRTSQWLLGKTMDKFLPLGPYVVTADEVGDPQALSLKTWMNGELRQDSSTADQIFSVAQVIAYTSRYFPLDPGDIVVTGTPAGVIMGMAEKRWLRPGDEVIVEVGGLGRLRNRMTE